MTAHIGEDSAEYQARPRTPVEALLECGLDSGRAESVVHGLALVGWEVTRMTDWPPRCSETAEDKFSRVRCIHRPGHDGLHMADDGWEWA